MERLAADIHLISIHAPAKGATFDPRYHRSMPQYFNPRSREGSDLPTALSRCLGLNNFNPRSREGSDEQSKNSMGDLAHFNPRSREGSDGKDSIAAWLQLRFQSTLPRRERRKSSTQNYSRSLFQSTLPRRERRLQGGRMRLF